MEMSTFKEAWELAIQHSGRTGQNCAVLEGAKGNFVFASFCDGDERSVRSIAEALGAKFVDRTYVLK
jgi:hypothetical protein